MNYSAEHIVRALKAARQEKGLSQRELSAKAGLPQGHISKIENGAVDLKLSSLISLARILDLEVMPVPRKLVPAVQALARTGDTGGSSLTESARLAAKQVKRIEKTATRLLGTAPDKGELARLRRAARELAILPLGPKDLESLRLAAETLGKMEHGEVQAHDLREMAQGLERARNHLAHHVVDEPAQSSRPAYSLEDGEDDA